MTFRDSKDAARKWRTPESLWRMPGSRGRGGARAGGCGQGRASTASSPSASYRGSASAGNSWTCGPRARHLPRGSQREELRFALSFQPKAPTLRRLAWGYRRNSWRLFVRLFNQQRLERTCRMKNAPCLQYANESSVESFAGQQQGEDTQLSSMNPSFRAKKDHRRIPSCLHACKSWGTGVDRSTWRAWQEPGSHGTLRRRIAWREPRNGARRGRPSSLDAARLLLALNRTPGSATGLLHPMPQSRRLLGTCSRRRNFLREQTGQTETQEVAAGS